ncbi:unnamed protein product [Meloidogyne enterolobii]|uniref:Uncharacterized protein n=2 Tax=Meloidogyne enterolobii TaxID=390850 RepID=A0ACB0ZGL5_MELEN
MLLRYQCNKDRTSSFSEVMATALMLVMLLQLAICLCAASEEVETTMDGYNPKLNDTTTVPDRVKRNPPPAPSNNDNSKCVKDPAQIHESTRGIVALGSIIAFILCLGLMLAVACGCICTETKMIDVE